MAPYLSSSVSTPVGDTDALDERQLGGHDPVATAAPIAVCGMALRLPGGISTPTQFWDFLVNKHDARGPVPASRYNVSSYYSKSGKPGHIKTDHGYFLDDSVDLGGLDTSFFTMVKQELERADPQQRILLELTRECLESAGETDYRGKDIGTYIGTFGEDWLEAFNKDNQVPGMHKIIGYGDFVLSNRLSYEYDLRGPSMTIKTGCSSGLIALHEACLAIRAGECRGALVGGSSLIMAPALSINMSDQGILSPNGSSRTFDADADGYARGEAVNLVYIKNLNHAIRDGNPIRAIIRSTSINADGNTASITVPSVESHTAMIRRAYHAAGISDFSKTGLFECHGTGTPTGDPIETTAISNVFGDHGVYIGSVKPNVGHSEGASGITSLIKVILALEHRTIPPNIKFDNPNPKIPFKDKNLRVPVEPMPWPAGRSERSSVNSFGIGGSNAHVILDSARSYLGLSAAGAPKSTEDIATHPLLMVFSANTPDSLRRQVVNQQRYMDEHPTALSDVAYTLAARRGHLPHRAFSVVGNGIEANVSPFAKAPASTPQLVMVFTGQGAQWPRMGVELMRSSPSFAGMIHKLDKILKTLPDGPSWTIAAKLMESTEGSDLHTASIAQPLCTAVQLALVAALGDVGIQPYAVVGHSSGEIAAAYASGRLSASEAMIAAYYRGLVLAEATKPGSMAAIGAGWDETSQYLQPGVVIACENSPGSVTISGDTAQLDEVLRAIQDAKPGVLARKLKVDKAYHSPHMKAVGERYLSLTSKYVRSDRETPDSSTRFFSSVYGRQLTEGDRLDAHYWRSNLESPVLFRTAVASLVAHNQKYSSKNLVFLEVGPHSALAGPLRQTLAEASLSCPYSSCLLRSKNATESFLSAVGQLWTQNVPVDFARLANPHGTAKVVPDLPAYPWQHDHSYTFETRLTKEWRFAKYPKHELLGIRVAESTDNEPVWRNVLVLSQSPWIRDHNIMGDVIFPCAGYIGMAGEAARQICGGGFHGFSLRNVVIDTAMVLSESKPIEIVTSIKRHRLTDSLDSPWYNFVISSHNGVTWMKHCAGQLCPRTERDTRESGDILAKLPKSVDASKWYQTLRGVGANYGPDFQGLHDVSCSTTTEVAKAKALHTYQDDEVVYSVHPTKYDFFLQLFTVACSNGIARKINKMVVPTFIEHMDVYQCDTELRMRAQATITQRWQVKGRGEAYGADGCLAFRMEGVKLSPVDSEAGPKDVDPHAGARIFWQPDIDFVKMEPLVTPNPEQAVVSGHLEELNLLCIRECLRLVDGLETTAPHLRKFLAWMRGQPLPATADTSRTGGEFWELSPQNALAEQLSATTFKAIVVALRKIVENVVAMFEGTVEPIEVLMPDNTLTNIYNLFEFCDRKPVFRLLGHSQPNLRILEIGAGTGGTTQALLDSLVGPNGQPMYSSYTYTDVSAGFFTAAKTRFQDYHNINYKVYDVSRDPIEQGFEAGSYHLVVAANVLHVTESLRTTLSHVRKLLHPEGRLYMEELCCDTKVINTIMGVLPGWWLGEGDGRPDEPYVSPERWDRELRAAGFQGLDDVVLDCAKPSQMVAFMTAKPAMENSRSPHVTVLHDEDTLSFAKQVSSYLEADGYQPHLFDLGDGIPPTEHDILSLVDVSTPFLEEVDAANFETFRDLMVAVSGSKSGLLWLTRSSQVKCADPRWAQTIGAARVIRGELDIPLATCELDRPGSDTWRLVAKLFAKFQGQLRGEARQLEVEYAIVDGRVVVPRLFPVVIKDELAVQAPRYENKVSCDLKIGTYGRLDTLKWVARPGRPLVGDEVLVEAKAVGLNFRDVLVAMGIVEFDKNNVGLEAGGVVRSVGPDVTDIAPGDRVAVMGDQVFSTGLIVSEKLCVKIPDSLSFEEAATMPCVFSTVIYGLLEVGRLERNQSVLIHSACGGVGLSAIQICRMMGAEIYCTVGNEEKVKYLQDNFGVPRDHIFNSRDASFLADVRRATGGRGVDIVLNSLSGELLHVSWECVAEFGKMIEIGKRDLIGNGALALNPFLMNRSYCGVDLAHVLEHRPETAHRLLKTMVKLYNEGQIKPINPAHHFSSGAVQDAFRFMQKGQHIGKIVVGMDSDEIESRADLTVTADVAFNEDASYLLVGGLGGLGRVVSSWMVEHGARSLVFLSRSAGKTPADRAFITELRSQGCSVTTIAGSATDLADVERAVSAAPKPLRGVINLSMVLRDQAFPKMTHDEWQAAALPKVRGTWNLHRACEGADRDGTLDFFVLFSSMVGIIGTSGQANYAGANTFLDAFVQYRHGLGRPAGSLDVGMMLDHGYVADNQLQYERSQSQGWYGIRTPAMLDALAALLRAPRADAAWAWGRANDFEAFASPAQLLLGMRSLTPLADPANRVRWKNDRRMAAYFDAGAGEGGGGGAAAGASAPSMPAALAAFLVEATSDPAVLRRPEAAAFVARQIAVQLLAMLLRPVEDEAEIDVGASLGDLGLDSLVAIEMRSWWRATFKFDISVLEMLGLGSVLGLGERAVEGLRERLGGDDERARDGDGVVASSGGERTWIGEQKMP